MNSIKRIHIKKISRSATLDKTDVLAVEDPLEIQTIHTNYNDGSPKSLSITMRTPGHDVDLSIGFLFTEGIINAMSDVASAMQVSPNHVWITLDEKVVLEEASLERNFYTTSSCGVCGKASIDAIRTNSNYNIADNAFQIESDNLFRLQEALLNRQSVFNETGGIHAAALFNKNGELLCIREDVGRHNALDKLIGHALQENILPLSAHVLLLSGRASFELIQKAGMAGLPIVVAVGAPSSLAVELAEELGITLIGFLKSDGFNVYTHESRLME